ncbi:MAG: recombinase family protein [Acidimicrobiales bacterium]
MVESPQLRAGIYCRISEDRTGEALGVARHEADCRALAARRGWVVADPIYVDNDISASTGKRRPEYRRLLDDLKGGVIGAVISWHRDRLHRSPRELEDFIEIVEVTGAEVATCLAGDWDLTTPSGRAHARILGAIARMESEHQAERIARKHQELAEKGRYKGGPVGFGYERGEEKGRLEIIPEEARLIQWGIEQLLGGASFLSIVRGFEDSGVKPPKGGHWSQRTVHEILTAPRIAGQRVFRGSVVGNAQWEPIVSEGELRQAQVIFKAREGTRPTARRRLLAGKLQCARCGGRMTSGLRSQGGQKGKPIALWECSKQRGGCGVVVREDPVNDWVVDTVCALLASSDLGSGIANNLERRRKELTDNLAVVEADRDLLIQNRDLRRSNPGAWQKAIDATEVEMRELNTELAKVSVGTAPVNPYRGKPEKLRGLWSTLDLNTRQAIVAAVIDHIEVAPASHRGRRFDPSRLRAVYR